jgi:hypothetical protein
MSKYIIIGIKQPGLINAKINGRFTNVELFNASDQVLEELYKAQCIYVQLAPDAFISDNPDLGKIKVKPVKISRKK